MKSHVSDLLELATRIYIDACSKCTVTLDMRDIMTLKSRVEHEGLSFLTITLPTLGSDLEKGLALGRIDSGLFRSFRKRLKAPAFLQGFFSQVFDESGRIFDEPSISCIEAIRQLSYSFKKLKVDCEPFRVRKTLDKFISDEHYLKSFDLGETDINSFVTVCTHLWAPLFAHRGSRLRNANLVPKHGPGATAERLSGNQKFSASRWHSRLEPYFPMLNTLFINENAYDSWEFERVMEVPVDQEQPVRITPVPKTLKGPRIIAIEPVCMQYTQQALSKVLVETLESLRPTAGHVNFTDQSVNRELALSSSKDGKFATMDLSSASDLVPYKVAIRMFDSIPDIQGAISACRSTKAQMPDGTIVPLVKFASMGSALCFPVEAMYFYTLCVKALLEKHNLPVTYTNICSVGSRVYVYGDDIIVPTDDADIVAETLQKYCCKVNTTKSFFSGSFRESCGMDAFNGEEVTPTYVRNLLPSNKRNSSAVISCVATSNLFYKRGYWRAADFLKQKVEKVIGKLPITSEQADGLGWQSFQPRVSYQRWGTRYQRPEVRTWVASPVYQVDVVDGYHALTKSLLHLESGPPGLFSDGKKLQRSARHGAVALKRRWVSPL